MFSIYWKYELVNTVQNLKLLPLPSLYLFLKLAMHITVPFSLKSK